MQTRSTDTPGKKTIAPYGSWNSPITSDLIVAQTISFDMIGIDEEAAGGPVVYFTEVRPQEDGRYVIVRHTGDAGGATHDVIPREFNARSRVHEYGGGAFCLSRGTVYFSNYADQRLYRVHCAENSAQVELARVQPATLQAITIEPSIPGGLRCADMTVDETRNCLYCVCEEHSDNGQEAQNYLARISLPGTQTPQAMAPVSTVAPPVVPQISPQTSVPPPPTQVPHASSPTPPAVTPVKPIPIARGHSFYSTPVLSPDSKQLAFLCWDHPNMPWDATTLMTATITKDGDLTQLKQVAGGPNESVFQPQWGPDGFLYYVCDRSGWWNLYRCDGTKHEPLYPLNAEFGQAQWRFGLSTYGFYKNNEIICAVNQNAIWKLYRLNTQTRQFDEIPTGCTDIQWLKVTGDSVVFRAASPVRPQEIVRLNLLNNQTTVLKTSVSQEFLADAGITTEKIISVPAAIEFPTTGNYSAHAFYYAPKNPAYEAPPGELPPLLVKCHGGPSGSASSMFNLEIQYWTSRGFAVADVNYGGSTGYGREYRCRLNGQWGVVDVDDAANATLYLVSQGLADKNKLLITGRSAGGFTVLCALTFKDVFTGGASYYGISDIEALAKDTHKFESHYDNTLVGPYPQAQQLYRDRSAIHHTDQLNTPIIFFQGTEDKVVLPDQTIKMLEALKQKGIPCAAIMFEGERHGFSKAQTVKRCLEGELYFYLRILGIAPPGDLPPLTIFNAERL